MDPIQLTIIGVAIVLTVMLILMSIQVWYILKEVRISFQKMNRMLEDMTKVTSSVGDTASNMSGLLSGFKAGLSLFNGFKQKRDDHE